MIRTQAWVLEEGAPSRPKGKLIQRSIEFDDMKDSEVLAEPLYGCWEGNMAHAINRDPIDICRARGEKSIILGNAGVVRILRVGEQVKGFKEGDICGLASGGEWDAVGFPKTILGYDAKGSMGILAKRIKLRPDQLFLVPENTKFGLERWAALTIRYVTAWDNWKVAYGAWLLQMPKEAPVHVWGWGGGVSVGTLLLAKKLGFSTVMICGSDDRIAYCESLGLSTLDRRKYQDLNFCPRKFQGDFEYRKKYVKAENAFLDEVRERTGGQGVSIFIDNIGLPVYRATLKSLGRQGVITTSGWKEGMQLSFARGSECINRHIHVFTHGSRNTQEAISYAEEFGWLPTVDGNVYDWDEIARLAEDYDAGLVETYFPIYRVNKE